MKLSSNFNRSEFKCNCGGCDCATVDAELLRVLEDVRAHFGSPVKITSGHRCAKYNASIGGAKNSQHTQGRAADIQVNNVDPVVVQDYLKSKYEGLYGIGSYALFTHIDTRAKVGRWNG